MYKYTYTVDPCCIHSMFVLLLRIKQNPTMGGSNMLSILLKHDPSILARRRDTPQGLDMI